MKNITILGSTGSVGMSALQVIEAMPERFRAVLLTAHRSKELLLEQALKFKPKAVAISSKDDAAWLRERLTDIVVVSGSEDLLNIIMDTQAHLTISAIVGAAGLKPTIAAIRAGSHIGLANKESMVIAGAFMKEAADTMDVEILPIDSEHNALHQCLRGENLDEVKRLVLTASGGPFRTYEGSFEDITPDQALKHPTWDMGPKISIDSATMMNKGLEVIEAHHLFGFPGEAIDIAVHPQSVVHSMIETVDCSYKCQMSKTDMRDPIQYALTWPDRAPSPFTGLDITAGLRLDFYPADPVRFPCIQLAYDALSRGDGAPAVLNAANEVAVAAFLNEQIKFTDIAKLNAICLEKRGHDRVSDLDEVLTIDRGVRKLAMQLIKAGI